MIYLIIGILVMSFLVSFLMRAFDIYIKFLDENIKLFKFDYLRIIYLLTKNFLRIIYSFLKKKDWASVKTISKFYIFNFEIVITLLVSITKEVKLAVEEDKPSFVKAEKKSSILEIIKNSFPFFNAQQNDLVFA